MSTISRDGFVQALERAAPALGANDSKARKELKHLWFDGKHAYAYNGGLGIRVVCETPFKGGLMVGPVLGCLKGDMAAAAKQITLTAKDSVVRVEWTGGKGSNFPLWQSDVLRQLWPFPAEPSRNKNDTVLELSDSLLAGLKHLHAFKPGDPPQSDMSPDCCGVVLFPMQGGMEMYATNRSIILMWPVKGEFDNDLEKIVLPHAFVTQLIELGKAGDKLVFANDVIMTDLSGILVCSNLYDNTTVTDLPGILERLFANVAYKTTVQDSYKERLVKGVGQVVSQAMTTNNETVVLTFKDNNDIGFHGRFKNNPSDTDYTVEGNALKKRGAGSKSNGKVADVGSVCVGLDFINAVVKHISRLSVVPTSALILGGDANEIFVIGHHK